MRVAKLLAFIIYAAAIFFVPDSPAVFGLLIVNLIFAVYVRADFRRQFKVILRLLPFMLFTAVFNLIFSGISAAGYVVLKLMLVTQATVVYAGATTILEVGETAAAALGFLKVIGISPEEIKIMTCMALSIFPILLKNAREMKLALAAKGVRWNVGAARAVVVKIGYDLIRRVNALDDGLAAKGYFGEA